MEPGRKSPAANNCHILLKLSTRLSGSSPTRGMTAQLDCGERDKEVMIMDTVCVCVCLCVYRDPNPYIFQA